MNDINLTEAANALDFISAECSRDDWLLMATALKAEFGEVGFDVWNNWSDQASCYKQTEALSVWKSINTSASFSIAPLLHMAKQHGYTFKQVELTEQQKQQRDTERAKRAEQRKLDIKKEAELTLAWHQKIAELSATLFKHHIKTIGSSPYLGKKKIKAFGIGFFNCGVVIEINEIKGTTQCISDKVEITQFFEHYKKNKEAYKAAGGWFLYAKKGVIAVPIKNEKGFLYNLQLIFEDGGKKFIKRGRVAGCFHIVGNIKESDWLLMAEGYATAVSLHLATGDAVVVAFNASNLFNVTKVLHTLYENMPFLICGDDDVQTEGNPGKAKAIKTANAINARWCVPTFEVA